jgi:hypothetical protein
VGLSHAVKPSTASTAVANKYLLIFNPFKFENYEQYIAARFEPEKLPSVVNHS